MSELANNVRHNGGRDCCRLSSQWNLVKVSMIAAFMMLSGSNISVLATEHSWSFIEHPHPTNVQLPKRDANLIRQIYSDQLPIDELCERVVRLEYQAYQKYYPSYSQGRNADIALQNWKIHAVTIEAGALNTCVYLLSLLELAPLIEPDFEPDLYYCGVYSRPAQTDFEQEMISLFDEYVTLVAAGDSVGASNILSLNRFENNLMLNDDVHFYFSLLLQPHLDADPRLPALINLSPNISGERKSFIENAAQAHNLQSVLDSTEPCAPRN